MSRYHKLFVLLLVTLVLASAAIAWAGWQAIAQQQQSEIYGQDQRNRQMAAEIGRDVVALLTDVKLQAATQDPLHFDAIPVPGVVLTGRIDGDRLVYAWDAESLMSRADAFDRAIHDPEFAARKADADRADARKDYEQEIEIYRSLLETPDSNQHEFARLLLAATYLRAKRDTEAIELYLEILNLRSDFVDENGNPLGLYRDGYAVNALLETRSPVLEREVLNRVNREIGSFSELARSADFVQPILDALSKSANAQIRADTADAAGRLLQRSKYLKTMRGLPQARRLQTDFGSMGVTSTTWRPFSDVETWLIGRTPVNEGRAIAIAVRAEEIRSRVSADLKQRIEFDFEGKSGETLHDNLPGVHVILPRIPSGTPGLSELPILFAIALTFVGLLLPGCLWLLWRDTRREVRVAELRSQFVSSVSHELKTPLTAIRMLAETLQMRSTSAQKHAQYLDTIVNESERLTRLLNNVLDFSRIERGEKSYHLQPGYLSDVMESAARTMRFPLSQQGFDLRMDISEVPPMPLDRDAVEQAVLNLLSNAMKYSGESRDVALRLSRQNGHALIQVEDRGLGIAADEQKRIFDRFYRVPTTENRAISGTGLGLALVAHIAEAHGGSVEVHSALGEGSTFSIRLPLAGAMTADENPKDNAS